MTIQVLTTQPNEKGTAIFSVSPTDEDGNSIVFAQLTNPQWQMMQFDGTVVPGCSYDDSALTSLEWVVSGDQLAIFGDDDVGSRHVTFKATYDSSYGTGLPLHAECMFKIQPLVGIVNEEWTTSLK